MWGQSKSYRDRIWSLESQWFNIRQAISPTSQWLAGQPAAMSSHSLQERRPLSPAGEKRRWLRISQWPMWIKHPFMITKYASPVSPCRFKAPVSPSVGYNPVEVFLNFHTSPATFWAPLLIFCTACSKCPPPSLNSLNSELCLCLALCEASRCIQCPSASPSSAPKALPICEKWCVLWTALSSNRMTRRGEYSRKGHRS